MMMKRSVLGKAHSINSLRSSPNDFAYGEEKKLKSLAERQNAQINYLWTRSSINLCEIHEFIALSRESLFKVLFMSHKDE
jgi:hypothetical protein